MIETTETDAAFQKGMSCKEIVEFSERMERERDEARAVIRFLWELAEIHLDLSEEELERVNRSWGASK